MVGVPVGHEDERDVFDTESRRLDSRTQPLPRLVGRRSRVDDDARLRQDVRAVRALGIPDVERDSCGFTCHLELLHYSTTPLFREHRLQRVHHVVDLRSLGVVAHVAHSEDVVREVTQSGREDDVVFFL